MPGGILAPRKNAPAVMRWCPVKTIMAKVSTDEKDDADLDDAEAPDEDRDEADSSEEEEEAGAEERTSDEGKPAEGSAPLAIREPSPDGEGEGQEEEEEEEEGAATQLGVQRYVLAAFFASGIVGAYILGKAIHGVWAWVGNKDWFHNVVPALAAVADDDKSNYATALGAILA